MDKSKAQYKGIQYRPDVKNTGCMEVWMYERGRQGPGRATICYYLEFSGCMEIGCIKVRMYESKSLVPSSTNALLQDRL